ncbi:SGT1 protein [Geosmithia morbida]|uniref:SGT1 protein n=1 Tax=Geosmithia morbida TaxID=1094350 RepID=A0A9P4YTT8_9HYPO|nr:SGT1 protein [Geosmithia morbida]KAF4121558.1 SGT1 protein [Geosmithia morbida]
MEELPHDPTAGHSGFERELSDNSVEYLLFIIGPELDSRALLSQLESLRKRAMELCRDLTKDYIWQRDEFSLELRNEAGLWYLHGMTEYGDAVEDEWLIVYLIRQLSRAQPNVWARVLDTDGEFLLIEAANVLPKWLSPEIDRNRVWIHNGSLLLVPCDGKEDSSSHKAISLPEAVDFIKSGGGREKLVHSSLVEEEAFYRLNKYPGQVVDSTHHSKVTIPRRLAHVLHILPRSIAPAVEAFYLRDSLSLKPVLSSLGPLTFPPRDLVTVSVRFSKVLFAQLRSQRFETPPRWADLFPKSHGGVGTWEPGQGDDATQMLEAGMKLTCGFEMLAAKAAKSRSRVVREMALLIEDMDEDGDEALPSDADIKAWPDSDRADSEAWLDIDYADFEREISGKPARGSQQQPKTGEGTGGFGDSNAQDNLRKIVSRFEAFLNDDKAGLDGAELDDMDFDDGDDDDETDDDDDYEDKEVSFDEEEFSRMMREMMGLPPNFSDPAAAPEASDKGKQKKKVASEGHGSDEDEDDDEDEDEDIQKLASQMEAELNKHGALRLDPPRKEKKKKKETLKESAEDGKSDDDDREGEKEEDDVDDDDDDSEDEVDVDYNLAKNLLESFKSQGGMSGPTGNMLGMMGLNLPRDEDGGQEDDEDAAGSFFKKVKSGI